MKRTRNNPEKFNLRTPDGMREKIRELADTKGKGWSMNDEFLHRIQIGLGVPDDVAAACAEFGDVKDRLDLAVRIFKEAGLDVRIPHDDD